MAGKYEAWAGCKPSIAGTHSFTPVLHLLWDMFCYHRLQMESCLPQTFPGKTINESTAGSRYFPTLCLKGFGLRQHPEGFVASGQWHRWFCLPDRYAQPRPLSARADVQELGTACNTLAILLSLYFRSCPLVKWPRCRLKASGSLARLWLWPSHCLLKRFQDLRKQSAHGAHVRNIQKRDGSTECPNC